MNFSQINAQGIKSVPVNMHFGMGHVFKIVGLPDTTNSLNDKSFKLDIPFPTASNEDNKVILSPWFNVNSAGTDPETSGATMLEVAIATDATLSDVHTALKTALEARSEVRRCWIENGALYVQCMFFGESEGATDVDSAFTFTNEVEGYGGFLGATEGGANITPEISTEEVTCDQTGDSVIAELIKSAKYSVSTTIKELTQKRMKLLFGKMLGEAFTPDGGTEIIGLGTSKVGANAVTYAGELILHPVSKASTDFSENIHFFKCAILPNGLNYGTEQLKTEAQFKVFVDPTKDERCNIGCFGNGFQDLSPAA